MRIEIEHIGKKVANTEGRDTFTVLAIGRDKFFSLRQDGYEDVLNRTARTGSWELVEEPKPEQKPSERIAEISDLRSAHMTAPTAEALAIIGKYLDEQSAKK